VEPITFAHRGARREEPENTIPAFRLGLSQGASGLETDAWRSADGQAVLVHDGVIRRGMRRLHVDRTDAATLFEWDVPTLAQLYETCGTDYELSIDVKDDAVAGELVRTAVEFGAVDRLWLCHPELEWLLAFRPEAGGAHLVHSASKAAIGPAFERHAHVLALEGIDAMNLHRSEWTKGLVALFHRFEVKAFSWDAQELRHIRAAIGMQVDGLYSDHVPRLVAAVEEFS
jgi:glycerophosphoryl diester phosphodiesterase